MDQDYGRDRSWRNSDTGYYGDSDPDDYGTRFSGDRDYDSGGYNADWDRGNFGNQPGYGYGWNRGFNRGGYTSSMTGSYPGYYGRGFNRSSYGSQGRFGGGYGTQGWSDGQRYNPYWYGEGYGYDQDQFGGSSGYGYQGQFGGGYGSNQGGMGTGFGNQGYGGYGGWNTEPFTYTEVWFIPGPFTGQGPKNYQRSDQQIEDDINHRLTQHGQLNASDINVDVKNGEVTLTGEVDNRSDKRMAEDTADSVPGVKDVHNQLKVRNRQMSASMQGQGRMTGQQTGMQGQQSMRQGSAQGQQMTTQSSSQGQPMGQQSSSQSQQKTTH